MTCPSLLLAPEISNDIDGFRKTLGASAADLLYNEHRSSPLSPAITFNLRKWLMGRGKSREDNQHLSLMDHWIHSKDVIF